MTTLTDHQQRELDAESGAEMDRQAARIVTPAMVDRIREAQTGAAKPMDAAPILRLLRAMSRGFDIPADEALELLNAAFAAEYARGRVDGAREMGDRLSAQRHNIGPAGLSGNIPGGKP